MTPVDAGARADAFSVDAFSPDAFSVDAFGIDAGPPSCDECLGSMCAGEVAACDDECIAVEACIRSVCARPTEIGDSEEIGSCQVACQSEHPTGRTPHLNVVSCAYGASCAVCGAGSAEHAACRAARDAGACSAELAACDADSDCVDYRDCLRACETAVECGACDATLSGSAGRALLDPYEECVARGCILPSWLP